MSVRKHLNYLTLLFNRYAYVVDAGYCAAPPEGRLYVGDTQVGNVTLHPEENMIEFHLVTGRRVVFNFDAFSDSYAQTVKGYDGNAYKVEFLLPTNDPARDLASCL